MQSSFVSNFSDNESDLFPEDEKMKSPEAFSRSDLGDYLQDDFQSFKRDADFNDRTTLPTLKEPKPQNIPKDKFDLDKIDLNFKDNPRLGKGVASYIKLAGQKLDENNNNLLKVHQIVRSNLLENRLVVLDSFFQDTLVIDDDLDRVVMEAYSPKQSFYDLFDHLSQKYFGFDVQNSEDQGIVKFYWIGNNIELMVFEYQGMLDEPTKESIAIKALKLMIEDFERLMESYSDFNSKMEEYEVYVLSLNPIIQRTDYHPLLICNKNRLAYRTNNRQFNDSLSLEQLMIIKPNNLFLNSWNAKGINKEDYKERFVDYVRKNVYQHIDVVEKCSGKNHQVKYISTDQQKDIITYKNNSTFKKDDFEKVLFNFCENMDFSVETEEPAIPCFRISESPQLENQQFRLKMTRDFDEEIDISCESEKRQTNTEIDEIEEVKNAFDFANKPIESDSMDEQSDPNFFKLRPKNRRNNKPNPIDNTPDNHLMKYLSSIDPSYLKIENKLKNIFHKLKQFDLKQYNISSMLKNKKELASNSDSEKITSFLVNVCRTEFIKERFLHHFSLRRFKSDLIYLCKVGFKISSCLQNERKEFFCENENPEVVEFEWKLNLLKSVFVNCKDFEELVTKVYKAMIAKMSEKRSDKPFGERQFEKFRNYPKKRTIGEAIREIKNNYEGNNFQIRKKTN